MIEYSPQERKDAADKVYGDSRFTHAQIVSFAIDLQMALTRTEARLAEAERLLERIGSFSYRMASCQKGLMECQCETCVNERISTFLARHAQEKANANTD